jgi:hypothetical protein
MAISRDTKVLVGVLAAIAMSGCGNNEDTVHQALQARVESVFDMGSLPLPNSPNQIHAYRVINAKDADHFVYVVERNNLLVSGATTNFTVHQGKTSHTEVVTSEIAPNALNQAPVISQQQQQQQQPEAQTQLQQAAAAPSSTGEGVLEVKCATQVQCLQIAEAIRKIVPQ